MTTKYFRLELGGTSGYLTQDVALARQERLQNKSSTGHGVNLTHVG
jgi:hypothetical protein